MKKYILILVLSFISAACFSQMHKINIYSTINDVGNVDYLGFDKLLSDTTKSEAIIDYSREYKIRAANAQKFILAQMTLNGWKLVSASAGDFYIHLFTLSKEIILDDSAYKLYVDKLNNEVPKK